MKNRKLFILLILVGGIWGTIIYKIIDQMNDDGVIDQSLEREMAVKPDSLVEYELSLSYMDPFLKTHTGAVIEKRPVAKKSQTAVILQTPEVIIDWSIIRYEGLVYNRSRQSKMGSIKINNIDYFVREGDQIEEFLVSEINSDSIKMTFQTSSKYIKKGK